MYTSYKYQYIFLLCSEPDIEVGWETETKYFSIVFMFTWHMIHLNCFYIESNFLLHLITTLSEVQLPVVKLSLNLNASTNFNKLLTSTKLFMKKIFKKKTQKLFN